MVTYNKMNHGQWSHYFYWRNYDILALFLPSQDRHRQIMTGCYPNSSPQAAAAAHCVQCQCFDVPPRLCPQRPAKSSQNLATQLPLPVLPVLPEPPASHCSNQICKSGTINGTSTVQQGPKPTSRDQNWHTLNQQGPKLATSRHQKWQPSLQWRDIKSGSKKNNKKRKRIR